jgi:hypothetical protein
MTPIIHLIDAYKSQALVKLNALGFENFSAADDTAAPIYAINIDAPVHPSGFSRQEGIDHFRTLLYQNSNTKFILYSFQSQAAILAQKPENHVVSLLPFIHLPFTKENVEMAIKAVNSEDYPLFNTASEHLLSGWALCGQKNFGENLIGQSVLIIEDEFLYWNTTYKTIFGKNVHITPFFYKELVA